MKKQQRFTRSAIALACTLCIGIHAYASLADGMVAYYPFDGSTNDISGNGNHGLINGNVSFVTGVSGKGAKFNGVNSTGGVANPDYIRVPNSASLKFSTAMSVSYWVRIDGTRAQTTQDCSLTPVNNSIWGSVLGKSGDRNGFVFYEADISSSFGGNVGGSLSSGDTLARAYGAFRHVAYTINGNTVNLYVNGILTKSGTASINFAPSNTRDLYIGVTSNPGTCSGFWYPLDGVVDELRIYNRALTASEVSELAKEQVTTSLKAPTCVLTPTPSTITAGQSTTLTATCTPTATSYQWSDTACASTSSTCTVTPNITTNYTVKGSNSGGMGVAAEAKVITTLTNEQVDQILNWAENIFSFALFPARPGSQISQQKTTRIRFRHYSGTNHALGVDIQYPYTIYFYNALNNEFSTMTNGAFLQLLDSTVDATVAAIAPFKSQYRDTASILSKMIPTKNPNLKVYRKITMSDPAANAELDRWVNALNVKGAAEYGAISFSSLTDEDLKTITRKLNSYNLLQSDLPSSTQTKLQAIQQKRALVFANASAKMNKVIDDESSYWGAFKGVFTSDPDASLDFAVEMVSIYADVASDAITLATPVPHVGRPSNYENSLKKLDSMLKVLNFSISAGKCAQSMSENYNNTSTEKIAAAISDCSSFVFDTAKDFSKLKKRSERNVALASAVAGFMGDGAEVLTEEQETLQVMKFFAMVFSAMHDVIEPLASGNKPAQQLLASLDLIAIQPLNAWIAGTELGLAASKKLTEKTDKTIKDFDTAVAAGWRDYKLGFLDIFGGYYFGIVDTSKSPQQ